MMTEEINTVDALARARYCVQNHIALSTDEVRPLLALIDCPSPKSTLSEEEHAALLEAVAVFDDPASVYANTIRRLIDRLAPFSPDSQR